MTAVEHADAQLRTSIRGARASGIRCLKAVAIVSEGENGSRSSGRILKLAKILKEEPSASLDKEFARCIAALVEDSEPCLLIFRADGNENIEDSRWLLVVWLPEEATEFECALLIRSRGVLTRLVSNPVFLRELFASKKKELTWTAAFQELASPSGADTSAVGSTDVAGALVTAFRAGGAVGAGPIARPSALAGLLQRLVKREDGCTCLKLMLGSAAPPMVATLEAKTFESRSASQLAKASLPNSACYFVVHAREELLFVLWCPEGNPKDTSRVSEVVHPRSGAPNARYAVLEASVLRVVVEAFPSPPPRVVRVCAEKPLDIVDGANRAAEEGSGAARTSATRSLTRAMTNAAGNGEDRPFPQVGAPADFPADWPAPAAQSPGAVPVSLALPERPVPPWRGGSKGHTIGNTSNNVGAAPVDAYRRQRPNNRIGTSVFRDM